VSPPKHPRSFEDLPVQLTATAIRLDAALHAPSPQVSASQLLTLAHDMDRLSAKVRQAADLADLQSRRPIGRAV
jgi:hypothetical protein